MNLGKIIGKARTRFEDDLGEKLWSDTELTDFANQAERDAAERAKLLEDDADEAVAEITALTRSNDIATATSVGHPFYDGQVLRIAGVDQEQYNKDTRVRVIDEDTFTFAVDKNAVTPATGAEMTAASLSGIICNIAGVANTGVYLLHPKVIEVRNVTWNGQRLCGKSLDELNGWWTRDGWKSKSGTPRFFVDPQEKYLTLVPKPTTAQAIHIQVWRLPLLDMERVSDEPEILDQYHDGLIDAIEALAYMKEDPETMDVNRAERAEAKFTGKFGVKIDANTRRTQRQRSHNQVRFNPQW